MHAWTHVVVTLLGQPAAGETKQVAASATQIGSIWDFVVKGGPVMIPIGLCSLVALAVIIERLIVLRRRNVIPPTFVPELQALLKAAPTERKRALDYCRSHPSAVAEVFAAGIKRLGEPTDVMERHIQEAGEREVLKLRKRLRLLSVIGSIAPLLGLLGTITGMINAFQTVAASGEALGRTELLAKGIYEAMITTAAGLIVTIPVLLCYHWLSAKIDGLVMQIDAMTVDFIEDFGRPGRETIPTSSSSASESTTTNGQSRMAVASSAGGIAVSA
jgi:biopolymer transport protein ExbB